MSGPPTGASTSPYYSSTPPDTGGDVEPAEPRLLGDVDGKNGVNMLDALEILKNLAKMSSMLDEGEDSDNWLAALITPASKQSGKPAIRDVLEILKFIAKMDSLLSGNPRPIVVRG